MSAEKEDLSKFRQRIDDIDEKIVGLLKDRLEIVKQVGEYKKKSSATQSFIRAGREANMLRVLTKKMEGVFPAGAVASIWRMIISTSLCTEQNMTIAAYSPKDDKTCYWRGREYYGDFVKTSCFDSANEVIARVAGGESSIGILPMKGKSPWWARPSDEKNDVYIFARIPFVQSENDTEPAVLAIANVHPEKTDNDISVISVIGSNEGEIKKAFDKSELNAEIIARDISNYLIEVDKFIQIGDKALEQIKNNLGDAQVRLMGSYAKPIVTEKK